MERVVTLNKGRFVYIAGQYRGPHAHDHTAYEQIDANISQARAYAIKLARKGIPFFCPHLNTAHFEVIAPDVPADFYLGMDLAILTHAWAIFLLPGWRESSGALTEVAYCKETGIPTYTWLDLPQMVCDWNAAW